MAYRLTRAAEDQNQAVLRESFREHGIDAADRYNLLILTAMTALGGDARLNGSIDIPRVPGVRAYPIRWSRLRVDPLRRVRSPRHLIVYRIGSDAIVEVLGLVYDRMVLSRAARRAVRDAGAR